VLLSRLVIGSPFSSAWLAVGVLLLIDLLAVPSSLSSDAFSSILPLTAALAIASMGQLLVIMNAGIDLSVPIVITMAGTLLIGLSRGNNTQIGSTIIFTLILSMAVGFANGLLVVVARINSLVATLAVGGIVLGLITGYRDSIQGLQAAASVPPALASLAARKIGEVSILFVFAAGLTFAAFVVIRFTVIGRRFQVVGGNPRAAWIAGIAVRRYQIGAYTAAGALYGIAGLALGSFVQTPTLDIGSPYLLGPIAAVVIAGTSLRGGTGSVVSTFMAAFFLTQLSQTLIIMGLSSAWQYIVFGIAIAMGLLISGDRILSLVGGRLMGMQDSLVWQDPDRHLGNVSVNAGAQSENE
jgi:ribose transport system permease protein